LTGPAAVITAAGASTRFGTGAKKEYSLLGQTPVLVKTVQAFLRTRLFSQIVVTHPAGHRERVEQLFRPFPELGKILLVTGGATRPESVFCGLQALLPFAPNCVLIHDGARPWVQEALIEQVVEQTRQHQACIPVLDCTDAMKQLDSRGMIQSHLDKHLIKSAQTPQGFSFERILAAYQKARTVKKIFSDDAEVYQLLYDEIRTISGDPENRKITFPRDLEQPCA
jgi:2-C-methyl-D-erythritol 4-phosphate cytidylyltransferase